MKLLKTIRFYKSFLRHLVSLSFVFLLTSILVYGQELPPRPLTVTVNLSQNLNFGAFYQGNNGGSIIIYNDGARSSTGDIVLLTMGYSFSTGLYDVLANPGTLVSILNGPDAILTGSNGGFMILQIGESDPSNPFIVTTIPPATTQLRIGGTLIVGNPILNPPGNYGGTFDLTFVQE